MENSLNNANLLSGKRIIFVIGALNLGGSERQALMLAKYLKENYSAEVHIWGFGKPGRVSILCDRYGIPWNSVPRVNVFRRLRRYPDLIGFALRLRKAKPYILLPYTAEPNLSCGLVWRLSGAKLCVWNQRDEGKGLTGRIIEKLAIHLTPCFLSNSHLGASVIQKYGIKPERVKVIHNAVFLEAPQSDSFAWWKKLDIDQHCFLACMVANLSSYKDHSTLLKAWRKVIDQFTPEGRPALLLLAGRYDNAKDVLFSLASELKLEPYVRFLGEVQDIAGLLSIVDLGIYSSPSEGFPNAILEYMAAGLPVVATDIPGIREALGPEQYSYLVPIGDDNQLSARIIDFANNRLLRKKTGMMNKQRVEQFFNPGTVSIEAVEYIIKNLG